MITLEYKEEWLEHNIEATVRYEKKLDQVLFRGYMLDDNGKQIGCCQYAVSRFCLEREKDANRMLNEAFQRVVEQMIYEHGHSGELTEHMIVELIDEVIMMAGTALHPEIGEIRYHIMANKELLWENGRITKHGKAELVRQVARELMRHSVYSNRPDLTYDDSFDIRLEDMPESMRERAKESIVDGFNTYARFATANLNGMPVAIKSGSVSFEPPDDVEPTIINDIAGKLAGSVRHKAIGAGG